MYFSHSCFTNVAYRFILNFYDVGLVAKHDIDCNVNLAFVSLSFIHTRIDVDM